MLKKLLKKFLTYYVYRDWNIAIADISENLEPINVKWMKHAYKDRWFADPFIIGDDEECYIVLVEECLHQTQKGRLARLYVTKDTFTLVKNETLLELPTHLSFPNFIRYNYITYIYPENAAAGETKYYKYGSSLNPTGVLSPVPLADAVIFEYEDVYYMLATVGADCNGNTLQVYSSKSPFGEYVESQRIIFNDNIARRAGNVFTFSGKRISPAQVNNNDYGEGLSLQQIEFTKGNILLRETKRLKPLPGKYPDGLHTFNVFGSKVVIDGYRYRSPFLHRLYVKLRNPS